MSGEKLIVARTLAALRASFFAATLFAFRGFRLAVTVYHHFGEIEHKSQAGSRIGIVFYLPCRVNICGNSTGSYFSIHAAQTDQTHQAVLNTHLRNILNTQTRKRVKIQALSL